MRTLGRYALWVVLAVAAFGVGAWLVSVGTASQYASAAQVDVEARLLPTASAAPPDMANEEAVVTSGTVVGTAATAVGMSPQALAAHLAVSVPAGTHILTITCTMSTPAAAQGCATAAAHAYVAFRDDVLSPAAVQAHDPLVATLVTPASLPTGPVGTHLPLLLLAGAVAGVVLGCLGAFVQGLVDDRVRGAADLERCVGAPVVAVLPRRAAGTSPATVFTRTPPAAEQEAYRRLRVHLEPLLTPTADTAGQHGRWGTVVLVTSPHGREGRTWTASNLAAALARSGSEVLLVDADMRHPALTEIFRSGYRPGLADLLTGEATTVDAAVPTGLPGLRLITAGSGTGGTDVIEASRLRRVCAELRAAADVVVIDAGPVLETADPVGFARVSDLVLVVADVRVSRRGEVRAAAAEVWSAGPRAVAGVVLRPVSRTWTQRLAETGRQWQPEAARQAPAPNAPNGQVAGHGAGGPFALLGAGLPGHAEGGLSEGRVSAGLPDMATPPADDRPPVAETSTSLESEVPLQPGAPEADTFDEAADGGTGSGHWEQASDSPASSQWVWVER